jgi:hypothetical protein
MGAHSLEQNEPLFDLRKEQKNVCFQDGILIKGCFESYMISQCSFLRFEVNLTQVNLSLKSATSNPLISLNMYTNKHALRSDENGCPATLTILTRRQLHYDIWWQKSQLIAVLCPF